MYDLGKELAFLSPDRVPVKIGLLIMGATAGIDKQGKDVDRVLLLGRHEEFSFYAARFLYQCLQTPLPELWELALATSGWGRIFAIHVIGLLREDARPLPRALSHWLLRDGYDNRVMAQYTAGVIADAAGLAGELRQAAVDDDLLRGAEVLLRAIVDGGPVNYSLDEWPECKEMFRDYRRHVEQNRERKENFSLDFLPSY